MTAKDWNLTMVRAREALALLPQHPGRDDEVDWGEIEIAQIDTGYTAHAIFGFGPGADNTFLRVEDGANFVEPGEGPHDPLNYRGFPGHGTRILSVLCGDLPGSMIGVAPGAPVIPYRCIKNVVVGSKKARKRIAAAIRHAVDINRAEVISMSLGFPQMSLFGQRHLGEAVDHAYDQGIIVVAAGGQVIDRVTYPGKFSRSIGVGGVKPDRSVWFRYDKSMAKRSIDIWGPADEIYRANSVLRDGKVVEASYELGDGTSYATAHVAAAAGMWLVHHRDTIDSLYQLPWQRVEAFRSVLRSTSQPIKGAYWPDKKRGILDIEALLKAKLPAANKLRYEKRKAEDEIF
jgi:subtilisin family serine protease